MDNPTSAADARALWPFIFETERRPLGKRARACIIGAVKCGAAQSVAARPAGRDAPERGRGRR